MKVLVIDDNMAIGEILKEVLTDAGYEVVINDNVEIAAKTALDPLYDFVILDTGIDGNNGLKILDSMLNIESDTKARVVVLSYEGEVIPFDSPYVKAVVTKPFLSSDIIFAINAAENRDNDGEVYRPEKRELRIFKKKIEPQAAESMADMGLEHGKSYILFQDNNKAVYRVTASFGSDHADILMITNAKQKTMEERFRGFSIETISLSIDSNEEFKDVYRLGTILNRIEKFIEESDKPVIVFDNLNVLIYKNGMNSVFMLIHEIVSAKYGKSFSLVVSVNAHDFTDKDRYILKDHLELYASPEMKPREGKK